MPNMNQIHQDLAKTDIKLKSPKHTRLLFMLMSVYCKYHFLILGNKKGFLSIRRNSVKGLGLGRIKIGPVKIAKLQSQKMIDLLSFLIGLNFNLSETFLILTLCLF